MDSDERTELKGLHFDLAHAKETATKTQALLYSARAQNASLKASLVEQEEKMRELLDDHSSIEFARIREEQNRLRLVAAMNEIRKIAGYTMDANTVWHHYLTILDVAKGSVESIR